MADGGQADLAFGVDAPLLEIMRTMRAMRRLSDRAVPRETLETLVEAATLAPTASNAQGCRWVVVTDRAPMEELSKVWRRCFDFYVGSIAQVPTVTMDQDQKQRMLAAAAHQCEHFSEIPAVFVACYDQRSQNRYLLRHPRKLIASIRAVGLGRVPTLLRHGRRVGEVTTAASVYPGVQNLLLTARALGLGATLTTWHLILESEVKKVLCIPRGVRTFAMVPVGWPTGTFGPVRRRPPAETLSWNRWRPDGR